MSTMASRYSAKSEKRIEITGKGLFKILKALK
jgi:hypothetical protein